MAQDVTVSSTPDNPRTDLRAKPTGFASLSPLQAGLLYGGAASTVLGPFGALVGLGAGILNSRLRRNFLDRETADIANNRADYKDFSNEVDAEMRIADPDEKRLLAHAQRLSTEGYYRLQSGDETGRALMDQANAITRGIMTADQQARRAEESAQVAFQRNLIGQSANTYRDQYNTNLAQAEDVDKQALRVLDLVAQPGFDPNKPFNKAVLAELLSTGIGGFYRDAPDMLDAVAAGAPAIGAILGARGGPAGAAIGGSIGDIIQGVTTGLKAKDFVVTAEDYNRIAFNMRKLNKQYGTVRMNRLAQQADALNKFARQTGAIPQDYSLSDYISGGVKELRLLPAPKYTAPSKPMGEVGVDTPAPGQTAPPSEPYMGPVNRQLRRLESWMNQRNKRPTN